MAPGERVPDPPSPVFCLTDIPPNVAGTTHLMALIQDSDKHIVLLLLADQAVHEPHPLLIHFTSATRPFLSCVRPAVLCRAYRMGGLRTPNWATKDIMFLATETNLAEKKYGLNGKDEVGVIVIRPDGYVAFSSRVSGNGNGLVEMSLFLSELFIRA